MVFFLKNYRIKVSNEWDNRLFKLYYRRINSLPVIAFAIFSIYEHSVMAWLTRCLLGPWKYMPRCMKPNDSRRLQPKKNKNERVKASLGEDRLLGINRKFDCVWELVAGGFTIPSKTHTHPQNPREHFCQKRVCNAVNGCVIGVSWYGCFFFPACQSGQGFL